MPLEAISARAGLGQHCDRQGKLLCSQHALAVYYAEVTASAWPWYCRNADRACQALTTHRLQTVVSVQEVVDEKPDGDDRLTAALREIAVIAAT